MNKTVKYAAFGLVGLLGLAGCGSHIHSEKWYTAHTKETNKINQKCNSEAFAKDHHRLCEVIGEVIANRWTTATDAAIDSGHPYNG